MIKIDKVSFSYGTRSVLHNVSLDIHKGEIVSLIGPNGAGKSTLLLIAMGLLSPQQGNIRVNNRLLKEWSSRDFAQYCAFVPQNPYLPPAFTIWESVLLGRTPYLNFLGLARKKDREIVKQALRWVEIENLLHRKVSEISGGERQRVVLARALAQEPECLFLDEPTNSLDVHHQVTLLSFIHRLAEEKQVTVFIVLHDLNLASTFSDRLILLEDGLVVLDGTPGQVMGNEKVLSVYRQSITVFNRPDEESRPAVLPVRMYDK
ncbi:MAG: ABC transporter ATP-binding protein [Spirochaetales bacterium]|nr:ABC transporter ATP-binding protein [Spirochaetales bacterium]